MRINTPSRQTSIVPVFAVLFLALTVLGWGTGYKISLYHLPGNPSLSIPAAKLLSQKERPSTTRAAEGVLPATPSRQPSTYYPAILMVALMFGLPLAVSARMREVAMDDSRRQRSAHSIFFSFRPPPALLPSN
jgi:Na+/H+-dicarboxylate symporter